jgi:DNA-binding PadR family transcriptional regulator
MAVDDGRELLILGILRRGPLSAYELTQAVKMHGALYRTLARGNIYEHLARFEKRGWTAVRAEAAARGPRKMKSVYQLTASGRRRFDSVLASVFTDPQVTEATFEVACVLLGQYPRERAITLLAQRLAALVAQSKRLGRLYGDPEERSGAGLLAMTHAVGRIDAEIAWVKKALADLRNPKWKAAWVSDDDATARGRRSL